MADKTIFLTLLEGYLQQQLSKEEEENFFMLMQQPAHQKLLVQAVDIHLHKAQGVGPSIASHRLEEIEQQILSRSNVVRHYFPWRRWASIAAVFILLLAGIFYMQLRRSTQTMDLPIELAAKQIKAPESNRAYITLADGQVVAIDSLHQISLAGGAAVLEASQDGLVYQMDKDYKEQEIQWNTLTNPRGSKVVHVTLSDGTKVWLNAGTTMTYPVVFGKDRREININGEGYLEVAHNDKSPFYVRKGEFAVQVLGTKFNFNAYDDGSTTSVALVEGSVRLIMLESLNNKFSALLKPGEQGVYRSGSQQFNVSQAPLSQILAWRDGRFDFEDLDFQEAMRQVERWYDIQVVYKGAAPDIVFSGDMDRNTSLEGLVHVLKAFNLKLELKDKVLVIEKN